jgi:hypothetical protein
MDPHDDSEETLPALLLEKSGAQLIGLGPVESSKAGFSKPLDCTAGMALLPEK